MASSNSSVSEKDGRYGNSSKQLWKEWEASYDEKSKERAPARDPEKDGLTKTEREGGDK